MGDAGDEAFEREFDGLLRRSMRVAHRILGDRAAAEDTAAEALARAYARWARLRDAPWRDGWVLRVTANLALDIARRRPAPIRPVAGTDEEDAVAIRVTLVAALHALPRRQREAIVLRYLSGLDEADVAYTLGISAGTVKTHIHRGLSTMRRALGRASEEEVAVALQR